MRKKLYLFVLPLFICHCLSGQTIYTHDALGNRIKRSGGPALPVSLVSFAVSKAGGDHEPGSLLRWETALEANSDFFEIQRSPDAKLWRALGQVTAGGDSRASIFYSFSDDIPLDGQNFYRLKMVDKDGTFAYSQIRNLLFEMPILAYPNPIQHFLSLKGWVAGAIRIFSNSGKLVYESEAYTQPIDLRSLTTGIYILKLIRADGTPTIRKMIKE